MQEYKNNVKSKNIILICFCILLILCLGACGRTASKSKLLSYAKNTYGKCKLITEEHSGSGSNEIRTLKLQDLDTGLVYSVTSKMKAIDFDGSVFGYSEQKLSDFDEKYNNYIFDIIEQKLLDLNTEYPAQVILGDYANEIIFDHRISNEDSKIACKKIAEIIANNDKKNHLLLEFLVYSGYEEVCIGYYDYSDDTFDSFDPYIVIDYVYDNIDKDAEYRMYLGGSLISYINFEELNKLDPDKHHTNGTFYFFRSSTGVDFVAFNMEDYGMSGIRCVTLDSREDFTLYSE